MPSYLQLECYLESLGWITSVNQASSLNCSLLDSCGATAVGPRSDLADDGVPRDNAVITALAMIAATIAARGRHDDHFAFSIRTVVFKI